MSSNNNPNQYGIPGQFVYQDFPIATRDQASPLPAGLYQNVYAPVSIGTNSPSHGSLPSGAMPSYSQHAASQIVQNGIAHHHYYPPGYGSQKSYLGHSSMPGQPGNSQHAGPPMTPSCIKQQQQYRPAGIDYQESGMGYYSTPNQSMLGYMQNPAQQMQVPGVNHPQYNPKGYGNEGSHTGKKSKPAQKGDHQNPGSKQRSAGPRVWRHSAQPNSVSGDRATRLYSSLMPAHRNYPIPMIGTNVSYDSPYSKPPVYREPPVENNPAADFSLQPVRAYGQSHQQQSASDNGEMKYKAHLEQKAEQRQQATMIAQDRPCNEERVPDHRRGRGIRWTNSGPVNPELQAKRDAFARRMAGRGKGKYTVAEQAEKDALDPEDAARRKAAMEARKNKRHHLKGIMTREQWKEYANSRAAENKKIVEERKKRKRLRDTNTPAPAPLEAEQNKEGQAAENAEAANFARAILEGKEDLQKILDAGEAKKNLEAHGEEDAEYDMVEEVAPEENMHSSMLFPDFPAGLSSIASPNYTEPTNNTYPDFEDEDWLTSSLSMDHFDDTFFGTNM
ncbi:hypothetical protein VTL71DRAFT_9887 [Oculimacula yallundae]|uniref:BZIP domain-containing protein n=1 Tax=Oculimacula yallundae TaxID=86028 RepID=A0ABR4BQU9_9HELO